MRACIREQRTGKAENTALGQFYQNLKETLQGKQGSNPGSCQEKGRELEKSKGAL